MSSKVTLLVPKTLNALRYGPNNSRGETEDRSRSHAIARKTDPKYAYIKDHRTEMQCGKDEACSELRIIHLRF